MKTQTARFFQSWVPTYQFARRHISKESNLQASKYKHVHEPPRSTQATVSITCCWIHTHDVSTFYYRSSAAPERRHVYESLFFLHQERFSCHCHVNGLADPVAVKLEEALHSLYISHTGQSHRDILARNGYPRTGYLSYSSLQFNLRYNQ